jgi:hypothetical protein
MQGKFLGIDIQFCVGSTFACLSNLFSAKFLNEAESPYSCHKVDASSEDLLLNLNKHSDESSSQVSEQSCKVELEHKEEDVVVLEDRIDQPTQELVSATQEDLPCSSFESQIEFHFIPPKTPKFNDKRHTKDKTGNQLSEHAQNKNIDWIERRRSVPTNSTRKATEDSRSEEESCSLGMVHSPEATLSQERQIELFRGITFVITGLKKKEKKRKIGWFGEFKH